MRVFAILALLASSLVACASPAPDDPRTAQCRQQAHSDPAVVAAIVRANSQLQEVRVPGVIAQQRATDLAVARCLGGPRRGGGVEPVQQQ